MKKPSNPPWQPWPPRYPGNRLPGCGDMSSTCAPSSPVMTQLVLTIEVSGAENC